MFGTRTSECVLKRCRKRDQIPKTPRCRVAADMDPDLSLSLSPGTSTPGPLRALEPQIARPVQDTPRISVVADTFVHPSETQRGA